MVKHVKLGVTCDQPETHIENISDTIQ